MYDFPQTNAFQKLTIQIVKKMACLYKSVKDLSDKSDKLKGELQQYDICYIAYPWRYC